MLSPRPLSATGRRFASSLTTKRRSSGPSGRRITYLGEKDIAYAIHQLASEWFSPEEYGEAMPQFQLRGQEGLELFEAAVNLPKQRFLRTKHEKAAALFRGLIKNHPLFDGNKRVAVVALSMFLIVNRVDFKVAREDIVATALAVATFPGNFPLNTLTKWIRSNCVGRPKSIVSATAEDWPTVRQLTTAAARTRDIRAGRPPRLPGRRVRVGRDFWEQARELIEAQRRGTPVQLRLRLE